ncbi:MAG: hypothetical protein JXA22_07130 [Candidatus Thermoplasmatota archaeon]|nr:hypothetical protein [Candidatus Thermoplasmatota archaeon]
MIIEKILYDILSYLFIIIIVFSILYIERTIFKKRIQILEKMLKDNEISGSTYMFPVVVSTEAYNNLLLEPLFIHWNHSGYLILRDGIWRMIVVHRKSGKVLNKKIRPQNIKKHRFSRFLNSHCLLIDEEDRYYLSYDTGMSQVYSKRMTDTIYDIVLNNP